MTPMFEQYHRLKGAHPNCVLFFRMGDFYECFYDDAELVARELDLTLTARNKHNDNPIPMAGVPHHAAHGDIRRLTDAGHRVAIADQVEDPALAKGLVKREVVKVVSPGIVLDPTGLEARVSNWMLSVSRDGARWGVAVLDASTGIVRATDLRGLPAVVAEIHRHQPTEALLGPACRDNAAMGAALHAHRTLISTVDADGWSRRVALQESREALGVATLEDHGLDEGGPALRALGALLLYARTNSGGPLRNVHTVEVYEPESFMVIDQTTRRNLELERTMIGSKRKGSLLGLLDRTATSMGSRQLREWLAFPLMDLEEIGSRQAAVNAFTTDHTLRAAVRSELKTVADIERICARVAQGTAHARDLAGLRKSLAAAPLLTDLLRRTPELVERLPADECPDVLVDLQTWLVADPPMTMVDGGVIAGGAHPELDSLVKLSLQGMSVIGELEQAERTATGIGSLKIKRNRVFGYFIEVTRAHLHRVPDNYLRKQTLSQCERYITPELKELEERVLGADERRKRLELELFAALRERVAGSLDRLQSLARVLAELDVIADLAEMAVKHRWCRPTVAEEPTLAIEGGRHPVVEAMLDEERFVPNDVALDTDLRRLVVLTGPNMAGKSTIMRQTALIVLLAQVGSFVPADTAVIGLCDRIFTRVGAADDLTQGQSTFMVEMSETSTILHHGTARSLVLLDEIGRGTSTYDGLAIAWAVAEDIADRIGCRTIFATHYHELCELADGRDGVVNQSIAVSEWGDKIVFLRKLKDGGASRSYGIQCAKLAGLPDAVVDRAKALLAGFESHAPRNDRDQLSLFANARPRVAPAYAAEPTPAAPPPPDALRDTLGETDPDSLSPREAHELLYHLKGLV
jgi:DNA mismatch repair protein MutS